MAKARKVPRVDAEDQRSRADDDKPGGPMSAGELLIRDHREVEELFEQFERMDEGSPEQVALIREISLKLALHARVEEELVYPMLRSELGGEDLRLADEAEVEHASVKHLLIDLASCDGTERLFAAKVKVLAEYVSHHVEEEESELIPRLEEAGVDLDALGERIQERKEALLRAYAPPMGSDDEMEAPGFGAGEVHP